MLAATYHQVWWPSTQTVHYDQGHLPLWDEHTGTYLDPATGEILPTWDQALDAIGQHNLTDQQDLLTIMQSTGTSVRVRISAPMSAMDMVSAMG